MKWHAIVMTVSFVTFCAVSAGKSDILKKIMTESWMTMENFTSLIDASYTIPQCVNIFISDQSAGSERLFKEFIHLYKDEYVLNGIHDGCDSFFFVAGSEEKVLDDIASVITVNARIETLIVVDDDVREPTGNIDDNYENQSGLFNVTMYTNTNVNIAARNGLWTLADNYLFSRVFTKVSSYKEMVHKKGIVNLEGEELQATTFFSPPLCFLKTTVNETIEGVEAKVFVAKDESELDGVEFMLFRLIAERLNFTYKIRKPSTLTMYGNRNGSVWEGGMIAQMIRGETHIAFGSILLTLDVHAFTTVSVPSVPVHIHFLVPRPKPHLSFWALTAPLSKEVWSMIIIMLIAQSTCVYTCAWVDPRIPKRFRSFTKTWTELMARLLGTWAPRKIHGLKWQFQIWHFFGILMVTAYSSSLAAKLTSREYDKRIDTARDFVKANLTWGLEGPVPVFSIIVDMTDHYGAKIAKTFEHETSSDERHEKILRGNYAIVGRRISTAFFPVNYVSNEDLKGYRMMRNSMSAYYATFAVTPWLVESVDKVLMWMQETGLVQYHLNDVLYRRMSTALREVLIEHDVNDGEARILELTPLGAGFAVYLVGLFISTVVFYLELRSVRGSRSIREVLIDIKKNREIRRSRELNRKIIYSAFKKLKQKRYGFDLSSTDTKTSRGVVLLRGYVKHRN